MSSELLLLEDRRFYVYKYQDPRKPGKYIYNGGEDIFDDIKKKATKEVFKVIDIIVRGGQRIFRLAPVGQKDAKEFEVSNKIFNKEFVVA